MAGSVDFFQINYLNICRLIKNQQNIKNAYKIIMS